MTPGRGLTISVTLVFGKFFMILCQFSFLQIANIELTIYPSSHAVDYLLISTSNSQFKNIIFLEDGFSDFVSKNRSRLIQNRGVRFK